MLFQDMEIRKNIVPENFKISPEIRRLVRLGVALTFVAALRLSLPESVVFADDGVPVGSQSTPTHSAESFIPVKLDSAGRIIFQPTFYHRYIEEGDNVWDITARKVEEVSSAAGYNLSEERRLKAINFLKNLTIGQNDQDRNPIQPGQFIRYPAKNVIALVVQNLVEQPSNWPDTGLMRILRQSIDVVANPTENPADSESYRLEYDQANRILRDMVTLNQYFSKGDIEAKMVCGSDGEIESLNVESYTPAFNGDNIWGEIIDEKTGQKTVFLYEGPYSNRDKIVFAESYARFRHGSVGAIRGGNPMTVRPNGHYEIKVFEAAATEQEVPDDSKVLVQDKVKGC